MGLLGETKRKKLLRILEKIANRTDLEILTGGKHNYKLKVIHNGCTYPLSANHPKVKSGGVNAIGKWLEKNDVCTYEEYCSYF